MLPNYIQGVIVGLLLSDAWLQKQNVTGQARLGFKQGFVHLSYALEVFFLLSHYFKSYPQVIWSQFKGKAYPALTMTSRSLACFTELYEIFYVVGANGKRLKVVPADIYNLINIQALAHWIAGDGSYVKGGGLYLQTQSFTIIDNIRLMNVLTIKFQCVCTLHMQRGLPIIYVSSKSVQRLFPLLLPHMSTSMLYKITKR
jgi:hypothetical protein